MNIPEKIDQTVTANIEHLEETVRENPIPAVLAALGVGVIIRALPVGGILALTLRTVLLLVKPVILMLIGVQLAKYLGVFQDEKPKSAGKSGGKSSSKG